MDFDDELQLKNEPNQEERKEVEAKNPILQILRTKFHQDAGAYDVRKLLAFGIMHCKHFSRSERVQEVWNVINPMGVETVSNQEVKEVILILKYIAVDQRADFISY